MLIALICDNGVIVEGGENSGALNLCDYLNEYGKDVYAVPGEIYSFASKGTNKLIADGRCSVLTSVSDIAEIKHNKIELRYNCNEKEFSG
jgi:Predicted Rossmann fold nucleotide-binding protein involved in DNA uptake